MRMHLMFLVYSDFKGTVSKYNSQNFVEHIIVRNTSNSTDRQTDVDIHSKLFFYQVSKFHSNKSKFSFQVNIFQHDDALSMNKIQFLINTKGFSIQILYI